MKRLDFDLPSRATWVFTGDSITQGVHHTHGSRSWVELVSERVRWELSRVQDIVVNSGVSAWTAPEISADFEYLVGRFAPQVLSVSCDGEAEFAPLSSSIPRSSSCRTLRPHDASGLLHMPR